MGLKLVEQRMDELFGAQTRGQRGGGVVQGLQVSRAFLRGLHKAHIIERKRHLLREGDQQRFILFAEGAGCIEVIQHEQAKALFPATIGTTSNKVSRPPVAWR